MNSDSLSLMLTQSTNTIKDLLKIMFDDCKAEIKLLREKNGELTESLEFSQHETAELKTKVSHCERAVTNTVDEALPSRIMRLEPHTRRKNIRINGVAKLSGEANEKTILKIRDIV